MIEFRQVNRLKGALFAILYVGGLLVVLSAIFSFDRLADFVNAFEGGEVKVLGFVVGAVALAPVILFGRHLYPRMELEVGPTALSIGRAGRLREITIPLADIGAMSLNKRQINALDLHGRDGRLLRRIAPYNDGTKAAEIAARLNRAIGFRVVKSTRKLFGQVLEVREYERG